MNAPDRHGRVMTMELWLSYCARHSAALPADTMRVIWPELKRVMQMKLTYDREAVDLGFCRLVPVPFRPNWRDVVLGKIPGLVDLFRRRFKEARLKPWKNKSDAFFEEVGLPAALASAENIAIQTSEIGLSNALEQPLIGWRIEVVVAPTWRRFSQEVEREKRRQLTTRQYLQRWRDGCTKFYEDAKVLLLEHISQTWAANADADALGADCDGELVPVFRRKRMRYVLTPERTAYFRELRSRRRVWNKKAAKDVASPDENVSGVRDVLSGDADVRCAGGNVAATDDGTIGNAGVLVPDVDQGAGGGRDVLGAG